MRFQKKMFLRGKPDCSILFGDFFSKVCYTEIVVNRAAGDRSIW